MPAALGCADSAAFTRPRGARIGCPDLGAVTASSYTRVAGFTLIEVLVALLIFSVGVLALVGMYAASIRSTRDAEFRVEAANYATEILQTISAEVSRVNGLVDPVDLANFALNASGSGCGNFSGGQADSTKTGVSAWLDRLQAAAGLPGAGTAGYQQITVNAASFNQVLVTLCWLAPGDATPHSHQVASNVN